MARVLLCSRGGAYEPAAIAAALRARGAEAVELDCSAFPTQLALSLAYDRDGCHSAVTDGVTAVWLALAVGTALPAMEAGMRETCVAASELMVIGALDGLGVFQLDPHAAKARADNKPYQLRVAQRLGLTIPDTIISNDPDAVRAFARGRTLIMKMLVQPGPTGPASDEADVVFTTALTDDELAHLAGLDLCPMIFQAQVDNALDVRATVVGGKIFAAAHPAGADLDWRRESYALDQAPRWTPYELPEDVAARLRGLLDQLGLNYGAADFIVRPDGAHVFLELNASGAFGFLGDAIAAPIAEAIAEVLIDPAARRIPHHD